MQYSAGGAILTDNNGNLKQQDHFIPDASGGVQAVFVQTYDYDSLNRLQRVREGSWQQEYVYDRWGNRTIHQTNTYGTGIPKPNFAVNPANNRLTAPAGFSMTYDAAGNLTNDTYTGAGNRTYDAENKITSAWGGNNQAQLYAYDGSGQRIKRTVNGVETWQVYGLGGELLAEYPVSGAATAPQKEYAYRNGQLLITAAPATSSGAPPTSGLAGYWKFDENSGTTAADFSGNNNTGALTSGASWATGKSGAATSLDGVNDYVQVGPQSSLAMTTAASFSAWIYPTGPGSLATYGGIILDKEGEYEIARFADGTIHWAFANTSPGYNWINTGYVAPLNQWTHLTITYDSGVVKTYINGSLTHTFSGTGAIGDANTTWNDFRIGGRQAVSQHFQGRIDEVRVYNRALSASEVATLPGGNNVPQIHWLVTDHLGTPRMVLDHTGDLNTMKRHDYLPFGEELFAPTGGRSSAHGYSVGDGIRQQFTLKERDVETGLDYFGARYYSASQGRFTSIDPAGSVLVNPQSLHKYSYVLNNPLRHIDSKGFYEEDVHRDLTVALAFAAGFSMKDAQIIGKWNQNVDDDEKTSPFAGEKARELYHFTTSERRNELWSLFAWNANRNSEFGFYESLQRLGAFLHAQQDSFSHQGFGPGIGHALEGHAPDKTYNNVPKADRMARDTFDRLVLALNSFSKRHLGQVSNYRVEWNETIAKFVHDFNAARYKFDKDATLRELIAYIIERRRAVQWQEEFERIHGPPPPIPKLKKN